MGIVIVGFGGVGKTELARKYKNVVDLESIIWKWNYDVDISDNIEHYKCYPNRTKNVNFPENYIQEIKKSLLTYDIVLVAYSQTICNELIKSKLDFILCYPEIQAKELYIQRYKKRGNNFEFINNFDKGFEIEVETFANNINVPKIILNGNETLEDYLIKNEFKLVKK